MNKIGYMLKRLKSINNIKLESRLISTISRKLIFFLNDHTPNILIEEIVNYLKGTNPKYLSYMST